LTGPSVSLDVPIFDQGQGAIAQLTSEQRIAQRTFEALAIDIRSEVNGAIDELIANRDLAEFYGKMVLPQQIQIVNETLLQYNAMQISTFELLSAKERQLEAERGYVEAWRDYWIARADLERAVGGRLNLTSPPLVKKTTPSSPQKTHDDHNH
jgi:outer membrane protein, heavy metal efflux system